jgi:hypothetical protein
MHAKFQVKLRSGQLTYQRSYSFQVLQRNILAGAVETILRNEFLFGRRDKFGAYAIDDLVILVSDVDEVPSRAALHNLRFHAQSLAAVTYLSMAWHHYAFNFGSRMLWGDMSTNQVGKPGRLFAFISHAFAFFSALHLYKSLCGALSTCEKLPWR